MTKYNLEKEATKLHEEFKELKKKTKIPVSKLVPGKKISTYGFINANDLLRMEAVRKELLENHKDFVDSLDPGDRFDIENF
jgi:hypothetical protein